MYTVPPLPTQQDVFDYAIRHLREQNQPALSPIGGCAYRGKDGLMCAVGCLISDEHYSVRIEGLRARSPMVLGRVEASIGRALSSKERDILAGLQELHDNHVDYTSPAADMRARAIANRYGLNAEALQ